MRKQSLSWIVVTILFVACARERGNAQEGADSPSALPNPVVHFSADDLAKLSAGVASSIEWYHYWFGDWPKDQYIAVKNVALQGVPISHANSDVVFVAVEELRSVMVCAPDGPRSSCDPYSTEEMLTPSGPVVEEYTSTKKRIGADKQSQRLRILLDDRARSAVRFGAFDQAKARKLDGIFRDHGFTEVFSRLHRRSRVSRRVRFRIGNFSQESQWIYFYIEGEPYFCTITLDETRTKFANLDWLDLSVLPQTRGYRFAEKRINQNGAWFVFKNGHLARQP